MNTESLFKLKTKKLTGKYRLFPSTVENESNFYFPLAEEDKEIERNKKQIEADI